MHKNGWDVVADEQTDIRLDLIEAIKQEDVEMVAEVLPRVRNVNFVDELGATPVHWASLHSSPEILNMLLERKADPNVCDAAGDTPLHWAAALGTSECVQSLLENGADREKRNANGLSALERARGRRDGNAIDFARLFEKEQADLAGPGIGPKNQGTTMKEQRSIRGERGR